jgi:anti-sigma regulatory factor (Ser/Thr protein kinase)
MLSQEFILTGDAAAMIAARDRIMDLLREHCSNQQQELDIMVALQEGLANAVLHGCGSDPSKLVRCRVEASPQAINIAIRDPGPGFDTALATDSTDNGTNLTEHGRGICLMRSLMDEVSYRHGGSELHLTKLGQQA